MATLVGSDYSALYSEPLGIDSLESGEYSKATASEVDVFLPPYPIWQYFGSGFFFDKVGLLHRGMIHGIQEINQGHVLFNITGANTSVSKFVESGGSWETLLSGGDKITGTINNDTLLGYAGDDVIRGKGTGGDYIAGGRGNDIIYGGAGSGNELAGGPGKDRFVFDASVAASHESDPGHFTANNHSNIEDFHRGQDKIVLDHTKFKGLNLGSLTSDEFYVGQAAQTSSQHIIVANSFGQAALLYDPDGSGSRHAVEFAFIENQHSLQASDFRVI